MTSSLSRCKGISWAMRLVLSRRDVSIHLTLSARWSHCWAVFTHSARVFTSLSFVGQPQAFERTTSAFFKTHLFNSG
jgi:hypothetical protein